jgi:anhydro-N-acetylmuramic acid kinase
MERFDLRAAAPADVQATLAALTARSIAHAVRRDCSGAEELLVCGGGAHNAAVMAALAAALPGTRVATTAEAGADPDWVEAMAFAWLAREALSERPGNLPSVTGAAGPRVLGAIYPP